MSIFKKLGILMAVLVMVFRAPSAAWAGDVFHMPAGQASIELVPVGDVRNVADSTGYGTVDHAYRFGKYHVTSAQYCVFLNAVAASDPYGLYNTNMAVGKLAACGIARSGNAGRYAYRERILSLELIDSGFPANERPVKDRFSLPFQLDPRKLHFPD